jgi:hypothetical protein
MTFEVTVENGQSQAVFHYEAEAKYIDSIAYLYNRDRGLGIIVNANPDGSVGPTPPMAAAIGEQIVVTFERDDQTVSTCIRLRDGQQSATDYCGP